MSYKYGGLIPQSAAPPGAKRIVAYDSSGRRLASISLRGLTRPSGGRLYAFGLVSDMHLYKAPVEWHPDSKLDVVLSYFEGEGCVMCAHCGDITQTGFYNEGDAENLDPAQFAAFKQVCDAHSIPVYGVCGNHESYVVPITNNLAELAEYTGHGLYFSVKQGNDIFLFLGQPAGSIPMSDEALRWLYWQLEEHRNQRCFVFVHPHMSSGNPAGAYTSNPVFDWWGEKTDVFKRLLSHYRNTILFHGHTHTKFVCQEQDPEANYSVRDGFRSVHVPSLSRPRDVVDGALVSRDGESYAYLVEVFEDRVALNGRNLVSGIWVPTGILMLDTTLVEIESGTFADDTGLLSAVGVWVDDAGSLRVYLDGVEIEPVVDDSGDLTYPGLELAVDEAGDATLKVKEA